MAKMKYYDESTSQWIVLDAKNAEAITDGSNLIIPQDVVNISNKLDSHTNDANIHFTSTERTKLSGISDNANYYILPDATATTIGGVKVGDNLTITSGTVSVANASTTVKGVVQLNDTLTSTSTNEATTANQAKVLKDLVDTKANNTDLTQLQTQLDGNSRKEISVASGASIANAPIKSPVNVLRIDGKTIVNLVPLFDSGVWDLTNTTSKSTFKVTINNTDGSFKAAILTIPAKPSTEYTLSLLKSGGFINLFSFNGTTYTKLVDSGTASTYTITTLSDAKFIHIELGTSSVVNATFENVSLVEGTQALPFVANVKGVTNPTIVNETNGTSLVVPTTLYAGEYVEQNTNGELVKYKKWQELVLDDKLPFVHVASKTGFKQIGVNALFPGRPVTYDSTLKAVKYNGSILRTAEITELNAQSDVIYAYGADLRLSIANIDSGWGQGYAPTPDEIKAYFLGWRMAEQVTGNPPYNGTGIKMWAKIYQGVGENNGYGLVSGSTVYTVPTTQNDSGYKPYRLIYELATPVQEVIQPYSDLTLEKGDNSVKVYSGRIVNELNNVHATPSDFAFINFKQGGGGSKLKYLPNSITQVYENGKPDLIAWSKFKDANSYGEVHLAKAKAHFNPTASYTVDYEPLYTWEVTAPIDSVQLQYYETLQAVVNELTVDSTKQQDTIKRMLENVVNEESGIVWIKPTFVNGIIGSSTCRFGKASDGTVYLFFYVSIPRQLTPSDIAFRLPKGYRPLETFYFPSIEYTDPSTTRSPGIMAVDTSGHVLPGTTTAYTTGHIIAMATFKAEQ